MEDSNIAILVDAKLEYNKQIIKLLKPHIFQGIKRIYVEAKNICEDENNPNNVLMIFQKILSNIPKWSNDLKTKEYTRIAASCWSCFKARQ